MKGAADRLDLLRVDRHLAAETHLHRMARVVFRDIGTAEIGGYAIDRG
ncbi:hypothetical protein RFM99_05290 [Mesorhizobium sp. VK4C]|nr:hypothetical protein [Mesorhizobium sp. VK4C]MDX8497826.1 hypothetical protein [Mesorhizobium sp. VK4C]